MSGKGTIVIGGESFPVDDIRLARGQYLVKFHRVGPCRAVVGHITLFGDDGRGIAQGKTWALRALVPGEHWICEWGMTVTAVDSRDQLFCPTPASSLR